MSNNIRRIAMQSLTHFDVCCSGRHVEIGFTDHSGKPALLYVPHESLSSLLMTLPAMLQEAVQRRTGDASLRTVYPLGDWQLNRDVDEKSILLTLTTPDGFSVSFAVAPRDAAALGEALSNAPTSPEPSKTNVAAAARLRH
jgi:hypothetical protein